MSVGERLQAWSSDVQRRLGQRDAALRQLKKAEQAIAEWTGTEEVRHEGNEVLKDIEANWHKSFEDDLARTVSQGMTLAFGKPLSFVVESRFARDASAVDFELEEDGHVQPILGYKGGGYIDAASFLVRMLTLLNSRPALAPVAALDEPFANVSAEFLPNVAMMLRQIVDETGLQLIVASHEPEIGEVADLVYDVRTQGGISTIELIGHGDAARHLHEGA